MKALSLYHLYHHQPSLAPEAVQDQPWLINNAAGYAIVATVSAPSEAEALQAAQQQARGERLPRATIVRAGALLRVTLPGDVLVAERQAWMVQPDGQLRAIVYPGGTFWKCYDSRYSVSSLAWSPDGQIIAAAEGDQRVSLHELASKPRFPNAYTRGESSYEVLAWSPDGAHLASGGYHGEVQIWHPSPSRSEGYQESILICCPDETRLNRPAISSLAWTPDGSQISGWTERWAGGWLGRTHRSVIVPSCTARAGNHGACLCSAQRPPSAHGK